MRRLLTILATTALLLGLLAPAAVAADEEEGVGVVVKLEDGRPLQELVDAVGATGVEPLVGSRGLWVLTFPDGTELDKRAKDAEEHKFLADDKKGVVFAEVLLADGDLDGTRMSSWYDGVPEVTAGTSVAAQPAAELLQLDELHAVGRGAGTRVAILDTGLSPVAGLVPVAQYDFVDDDGDAADVGNGLDDDGDGLVDEAAGHGTHVAGIVHMVAPEAELLAYRVLDSDGRGSVYAVVEAIGQAVADGADVINLSFGTHEQSKLLKEAIKDADKAGVMVVAAAGNTGVDDKTYPAAFSHVVAAGASTVEDTAAPFSSHGGWVDVYAPAVGIQSVLPDGSVVSWSGTSMAAPFVAGLGALLREVDPEAKPKDLEKAMRDTGRRFHDARGHDSRRIDLIAAVREMLG